ncbi:MAG: transglutaminase domain-containing protein, partial [Pyrinomonadaceae bacterium]|nr:transglutaminase domain-containing protein [Phycisphaerales bacterium]
KAAAMPAEWPAAARPWLASTVCVQAADDRIRAIATELRSDSTDVIAIIDATLKRAGEIFASQTEQCRSLDAVSALKQRGSCTSRANLVAAILRASGVPARVLAGYPAWSGPLQTHYIVEAYIPAYGWYPIESTKLAKGWNRHQQVQVAIIPPQYEDRSGMRPGIAKGVPFLSLTERGEGSAAYVTLGTLGTSNLGCDHEARPVRNLPIDAPAGEWTALLNAARPRWEAWLASAPVAGAKASLTFGPAGAQLISVDIGGLRAMLAQ